MRSRASLTGLPLGASTLRASVPGPGNSALDRATLTLTNHPITGPMFAGPKQPNFFCSTPAHLAGFDLSGPFLDANCSLPTRVGHYYRASNATWRPFDPAAPRPADMTTTTTSAGQTVDFVIRWERGTIDRFIYTIAVLDPTATGPSELPYWNRKLIFYFGGGVAIGHYQGSNNQGESRYVYAARSGLCDRVVDRDEDEHPLQPRPRRRDRADGEVALRHRVRRPGVHRRASAARAAPSSSTSTARTTSGCSTARSRSTPTRTWSRRRFTSATASCSSAGWTARSARAGPSRWRVWSNRSLLEGLATSNTVANPYQPLTPWLAAPGSTECVKGWRGLSPLALNPHFGTAPGITPEQQAQVEWTHWNDVVNVYGRDPRRASPARRGTTSASSTA